jgi:outer membrane protein assembly factor BamB
MSKNILKVGIIFLYILFAMTPMSLGFYVNTPSKESKIIDDLDFYFYDEHDSSKADYYRKCLEQALVIDDNNVEAQFISGEPLEQILNGGLMDSAWPMYCHDVRHTGRSPYSTADNSYDEKWRFKPEGWIDGGITIDNDGILYFGDKKEYFYAITPNGFEKWRYRTGGYITSTPAISEDGTIYVGSWDTRLYAFNPNGTKNWSVGTGGSIASSPAIGEDGTIYFGTMRDFDKGDIVAVNPNGTIKWRYTTGYYIIGGPAISDDGTIYIGSGDTYLYAMWPNGTLRWRFKTGDIIKTPPSIANDGTIYIGSYDDYLYALYPNGTNKWKCHIPPGTELNPSIASDGTIYTGFYNLYAVNPNGTIKWSFNPGSDRYIFKSSPTISDDGTIYVGTHIGEVTGGEIIAINPDGTEKWREKISYHWIDSTSSIAEDGTIYIGSSYEIGRGYLHAFGSVESNTPPEAPSISGEQSGKIGEEYWYEIGAVDPDNNPISLYIEWGDGTNTDWTRFQASGEKWYYDHTWSTPDTYTIRAKAKDNFNEESNWTEFEIKISNPRTRTWLRFIDMFPIFQRLLAFMR